MPSEGIHHADKALPSLPLASGTRTGRHYQIEARAPMTVGALKGLLDNFLRSAIGRNVELAHHA